MFALMPAAVIHSYTLVFLLFFFSFPKAIAQAHSQTLLGSCSFESSTCGYTSGGELTSWNLHKDGIRILCIFLSLFYLECWHYFGVHSLTLVNIWYPVVHYVQHLEQVRLQIWHFESAFFLFCFFLRIERPDLQIKLIDILVKYKNYLQYRDSSPKLAWLLCFQHKLPHTDVYTLTM